MFVITINDFIEYAELYVFMISGLSVPLYTYGLYIAGRLLIATRKLGSKERDEIRIRKGVLKRT
jgi:hypothetical protein